MTVAFDTSTKIAPGTGTLTVTHTPVSSTPRGICILLGQVGTTDGITTATYGGIAVPDAIPFPVIADAGDEPSVLHAFFLGTGVPTGPQDVVVNVNNANTKWGTAFTLTGDTDLAVLAQEQLNDVIANPSILMELIFQGPPVWVGAIFASGVDALVDATVGADYTQVDAQDFGTQIHKTMRRTDIIQHVEVQVNYTAVSEDAGILALAIGEAAPAAEPGPIPANQREAFVAAHNRLIDMGFNLAGQDVAVGFGLSGHGPLADYISPNLAQHMDDLLPADYGRRMYMQANGFGPNGEWGATATVEDQFDAGVWPKKVARGLQDIHPANGGDRTAADWQTMKDNSDALTQVEYWEIYHAQFSTNLATAFQADQAARDKMIEVINLFYDSFVEPGGGGTDPPPPPPSGTRGEIYGTWTLLQVNDGGGQTALQALNNQETAIRNSLNNFDTTGLSIRVRWADIERTEGVYDWSVLDKAKAIVDSIGKGKQLMFRFMAGRNSPDWLLNDAACNTMVYDGSAGEAGAGAIIPLPFLTNGLRNTRFYDAWTSFVTAWIQKNGDLGTTIQHLAWPGLLWAEIALTTQMTQQTGYTYAVVRDMHLDMINYYVDRIGTHMDVEFPVSGHVDVPQLFTDVFAEIRSRPENAENRLGVSHNNVANTWPTNPDPLVQLPLGQKNGDPKRFAQMGQPRNDYPWNTIYTILIDPKTTIQHQNAFADYLEVYLPSFVGGTVTALDANATAKAPSSILNPGSGGGSGGVTLTQIYKTSPFHSLWTHMRSGASVANNNDTLASQMANYYGANVHAEGQHATYLGDTTKNGSTDKTLARRLVEQGVRWVTGYENGSYVHQGDFAQAGQLETEDPLGIATLWPGSFKRDVAGINNSVAILSSNITATQRTIRFSSAVPIKPGAMPNTYPFKDSRQVGTLGVNTHSTDTTHYVGWMRIRQEIIGIPAGGLAYDSGTDELVVTNAIRGMWGTTPLSHNAGLQVHAPVYVGVVSGADAPLAGTPDLLQGGNPTYLRYAMKIWRIAIATHIAKHVETKWDWPDAVNPRSGYNAIHFDVSTSVLYNQTDAFGELQVRQWDNRNAVKMTNANWAIAQIDKFNNLAARASWAGVGMISNSPEMFGDDQTILQALDTLRPYCGGRWEGFGKVAEGDVVTGANFTSHLTRIIAVYADNEPMYFWNRWDRQFSGTGNQAAEDRYLRASYALALLGYRAGKDKVHFGAPWGLTRPPNGFFWDLGLPTGNAPVQHSDLATGTGLYRRFFEFGVVVANSTTGALNFTLPAGTWYVIMSAAVGNGVTPATAVEYTGATISVPAQDAVILVRTA